MASKRVTVEEAQRLLDDPETPGTVWALNYGSDTTDGDWIGMQAGDELDAQYGPFIYTDERDEPIDATVLTLDEQIKYEEDRVNNAEELEIDQDKAIAHLRVLRDLVRDPEPVDIIQQVLEESAADGSPEGVPYRTVAKAILKALTEAKIEIFTPGMLEWGVCEGGMGSENASDPHRVSTSLCSGCLEYDPL